MRAISDSRSPAASSSAEVKGCSRKWPPDCRSGMTCALLITRPSTEVYYVHAVAGARRLAGAPQPSLYDFHPSRRLEPEQLCGPMITAAITLARVLQAVQIAYPLAEIPFIQRLSENALVHALQLAERESLRHKLQRNRRIVEFGGQTFLGHGDDPCVVETQFGQFVDLVPSQL